LAALPENQRMALLLSGRRELSYDEIAEVLSCSLSATKYIDPRARETLKLGLNRICGRAIGGEK